jgi:hypothetical protein
MDDFSLDQVTHSASIPFHWDPKLRQTPVLKRHRLDMSEFYWSAGIIRELTIKGVQMIELDDPHGLIEHSLSKLIFSDGDLILLSNFKGCIRVRVLELDLRLVERNLGSAANL